MKRITKWHCLFDDFNVGYGVLLFDGLYANGKLVELKVPAAMIVKKYKK